MVQASRLRFAASIVSVFFVLSAGSFSFQSSLPGVASRSSSADSSAYFRARPAIPRVSRQVTPVAIARKPVQGQFVEAPEYPTVDGPSQMAVGDFNGDGIPDLVTGSFSSAIGVLFGKGDGSFQPVVPLGVKDLMDGAPVAHWAVATGDLNGDGFDDIVVSSIEWGHLTVFLSNGDGTFTLARRLYGVTSFGLKIGDVNGDGKLDIVAAEYGGNGQNGQLAVFLGNGDGTFKGKHFYVTGVHPDMVAIGDVNGDGKPDLISANSGDDKSSGTDTVSVLLGKGDGTFGPKTDFTVGLHPQSVTLGDFNRDGRMDIVAANLYGNTVTVLLGLGNGAFADGVSYEAGLGPVEVVAADVNGDHILDLVTVNNSYTNTSVLLGYGDGTFRKQQKYGAGAITFGIAVADFDHDGKPDIAVTNDYGASITVQKGRGDGTFIAHREYQTGIGVSGITAIRDGGLKPSLALSIACGGALSQPGACDVPGYFEIMHKDSSGGFVDGERYPSPGRPVSPVAADLNGDGVDDIAGAVGSLVSYSGWVSVYVRDVVGNATRKDYPVGGFPTQVAAGDFNGDGKLDLASSTSGSSTLSVLLNKGNGTFHKAVNYLGAPSGNAQALAVADFNGDGKLDIVTADFLDGVITLFFGKGNGAFRPGLEQFLPLGTYPIAIAAGDFNHDGKADLAVVNYLNDRVDILLGYGDGGFHPAVSYLAGAVPRHVTVADINRDGNPDLIVSNSGGGDVSILYGVGDGTFLPAVSYEAGGSPISAVAVDVNGDGFPDLAVAPQGFDLVILRNTGKK